MGLRPDRWRNVSTALGVPVPASGATWSGAATLEQASRPRDGLLTGRIVDRQTTSAELTAHPLLPVRQVDDTWYVNSTPG